MVSMASTGRAKLLRNLQAGQHRQQHLQGGGGTRWGRTVRSPSVSRVDASSVQDAGGWAGRETLASLHKAGIPRST